MIVQSAFDDWLQGTNAVFSVSVGETPFPGSGQKHDDGVNTIYVRKGPDLAPGTNQPSHAIAYTDGGWIDVNDDPGNPSWRLTRDLVILQRDTQPPRPPGWTGGTPTALGVPAQVADALSGAEDCDPCFILPLAPSDQDVDDSGDLPPSMQAYNFSLRHILKHEIGHYLGISHSEFDYSVMWGSVNPGVKSLPILDEECEYINYLYAGSTPISRPYDGCSLRP